eukprot:TRINITY_DN48979_c0_g1_i1.p1 TRINITY_DN48979_c0_g1~~TRINITY_DN48979_c0_g1_i1.p1  ORF type:complete len:167 (+),score=22.12 TRINITY_DN48979_c0_g1_i1:62-502(+)
MERDQENRSDVLKRMEDLTMLYRTTTLGSSHSCPPPRIWLFDRLIDGLVTTIVRMALLSGADAELMDLAVKAQELQTAMLVMDPGVKCSMVRECRLSGGRSRNRKRTFCCELALHEARWVAVLRDIALRGGRQVVVDGQALALLAE